MSPRRVLARLCQWRQACREYIAEPDGRRGRSEVQLTHIARVDMGTFLAELRSESQPLLFVPNSGNAGDALIGHATFRLFDRLGLRYQVLANWRGVDPGGRVVIGAGGGNLVPLYHGTDRMLQWASGRARRIIVLPHTIRGHEELLAGLGPEVDLVCREMPSYREVSRAVRRAQCHLADDMALSLDVRATLARPPEVAAPTSLYARKLVYRLFRPSLRKTIPSPRKLRRSDDLLAGRRGSPNGGAAAAEMLQAFREDVEKTDVPLPQGNLDVAQEFSHGTRSPHVCHVGAFHLLRYLDTFEEVHTNRLHVCIGAVLLGKRVRLAPNSYCKNQAVWEFSLQGRFDNVEWTGPVAVDACG
jgi:exopolysaccharide biosynthesis predicted pyruvyltransferase EpsI